MWFVFFFMFLVLVPSYGSALTSYRGTYDLSLESASPGSGKTQFGTTIRSAEGTLIISRQHDCTGSALAESFRVILYEDNGEQWSIENEGTSWESPDHQEYQFDVWGRQNRQLVLKKRGSAQRQDNGDLLVNFHSHFKGQQTITLSSADHPLLLPVQAEQIWMTLAQQGKTIINTQAFEPNLDDLRANVSLFVGNKTHKTQQDALTHYAPKTPNNESHSVPCAHKACDYWPLLLGYHHTNATQDGAQTPFFEARYTIDEQGVLWAAQLKYDGFSLNVQATELKSLKDMRSDCP
ncbi:MAG: DUF1849 family protein [Alphaproteobacteria bacterium GM202ARS2]|nr:DUF1849 family protein [Alphaproteobacteria bacterium GM202ARS2]